MTTGLPDWTRGFVLYGVHEGVNVPILVDASGNLYALLQGEYEGAPTTIQLDDEGRISAFVVDSSDVWEQIVTVGNAELAARLGSIVRHSRSGQVLIAESFEWGLGSWNKTEGGTGAAVALTPSGFVSGGYAVTLTAGSDSSCKAAITQYLGGLPVGAWGLACSFSIVGTPVTITLNLSLYTGTYLYTAQARCDHTNHDVDIYNGEGDWESVADYTLSATGYTLFNRIKVTFDLSTELYKALYLNETEIDLSAHSLRKTASAVAPYLWIEVAVVGRSGSNDGAIIDDVILTAKEP